MTDVTRWLIESNRLFNAETTIMYPDVTNLMPSPFDPNAWYGNTVDPDLAYSDVNEPNPSGASCMGRFEYVGTGGTATFAYSVDTPFLIGDKVYTACLLKKGDYPNIRHIVQEFPAGTVTSDFRYNFEDDVVGLNTAGIAYKRTDINDDYCIVETEYVVLTDSDHRGGIWGESITGAMPLGSVIIIQAAFFGKADDWPALVQPVQVC